MIARIRGTLIDKAIDHIVVETGGVGYLLYIPLSTYYDLPEPGETVSLHVHTLLTQNALSLHGFVSPPEKTLFQMLLTVSGIGSKVALGILSGITVEELLRALREDDWRRLVHIPGVGKKTAERLVLELRDKAKKISSGEGQAAVLKDPSPDSAMMEDVVSALVNLGYRHQAAQEAVKKIIAAQGDKLTMDALLKGALRWLAG
jgi:Holliday junction DNA helicase RuvA